MPLLPRRRILLNAVAWEGVADLGFKPFDTRYWSDAAAGAAQDIATFGAPMRRLTLLLAFLIALPAAAQAGPMSGARQLTFEGARAGEGYFSADGRRMIFQSEREDGNPFYQMYLLDLETGDVERLSPGFGKTTCGWLHPDGTRRALRLDPVRSRRPAARCRPSSTFRASGQTRRYSWDYDPTFDIVETIDLETGDFTRLTEARGYDAEGAYSPDGKRIVFASNRHAYAADPVATADAARLERDPSAFMELYVMDADGSNVRRLTEAPGYDGGPFWSADGTRITWRRFSEDGARAEIYTMNADGSGRAPADRSRRALLGALLPPLGRLPDLRDQPAGLRQLRALPGRRRGQAAPVRVTEREGFDGLATFSPDGRTISWTSNATPNARARSSSPTGITRPRCVCSPRRRCADRRADSPARGDRTRDRGRRPARIVRP